MCVCVCVCLETEDPRNPFSKVFFVSGLETENRRIPYYIDNQSVSRDCNIGMARVESHMIHVQGKHLAKP